MSQLILLVLSVTLLYTGSAGLAAGGKETTKEGYLIVTGEDLAKSIEPFARWKEEQGFKVEILKIEKKDSSVDVIKDKIQKVYDKWKNPSLNYVLLVGDIDTIPSRSCTAGRERYVSDLCYSTLKGEDYFPDVGLGRLPARTEGEATAMINKIIGYEKGQFKSTDWIRRASFITPKAFYKQCEKTADYCINFTKKAGYTGTFPEKSQSGGDQLYAGSHRAGSKDLSDAFNHGRAIIIYQGHAFENGWANPRFGHQQIRSITNKDARPFVISVSCLTGRFDGRQDCVGETWIKQKTGAVAFFGAAGNSLFPHCLQMQKGIFDAIFKDKVVTLSKICDAAKKSIYDIHKSRGSREMYEMYNLFGDPSMKLRLAKPSK